ncbi:MAG: CpsD/CapB family tyrosine-protein kinase, partial [Planctomycetales bacterium]|nr:CpsD/CapB family tyrosine-protein kinase [Planctomycetales bacterium]
PGSSRSESYRAVRTALYFSTRGEEHTVFQVTSPNAGDGKTTLASNLAISFAQTGDRTLLIDADLRKPRVHRLFALDAENGLAAVIDGAVDVADAIVESAVPGLHLLPAGKTPRNPAELLTKPRFQELINLVRDQYDYVIVDTPPLLAVTDPCVVAPRVDGVLLTIRITKQGRPQAERAKAILSSLKTKLLGVVVNDADDALRGAGYGYGYGYGRNYNAPYGQQTGERKAKGIKRVLSDALRDN